MLRTLVVSTVIAIAGLRAGAEPQEGRELSALPPDVAARVVQLQRHGDRYEAAIEAIFAEWSKPASSGAGHALDLSILPPDVAAQVIALQRHGDRFRKAIRAIFLEAVKPDWRSGDRGPGDAGAARPRQMRGNAR